MNEISNIRLNRPALLKFLHDYRAVQIWGITDGEGQEGIFGLAAFVSLASLFGCGVGGVINWWIPCVAILWGLTIWFYHILRGTSDKPAAKNLDNTLDVLKKAMKRGKIGITKSNRDTYSLTGIYYNDLIGEEVKDAIMLDEDDVRKLYDMLDGLGNFTGNQIESELPVSTIEIPINL